VKRVNSTPIIFAQPTINNANYFRTYKRILAVFNSPISLSQKGLHQEPLPRSEKASEKVKSDFTLSLLAQACLSRLAKGKITPTSRATSFLACPRGDAATYEIKMQNPREWHQQQLKEQQACQERTRKHEHASESMGAQLRRCEQFKLECSQLTEKGEDEANTRETPYEQSHDASI
jgi:hypothetical protein